MLPNPRNYVWISAVLFQEVSRNQRHFNSLHIPKELQKALPFKSKPKQQQPKGKPGKDLQRPIAIREPHERKVRQSLKQRSEFRINYHGSMSDWKLQMKLNQFDFWSIFVKSASSLFVLGCSPAPCPEHSPQLQEKESACFSARQAQGVLTGKEENGRSQAKETEGGT